VAALVNGRRRTTPQSPRLRNPGRAEELKEAAPGPNAAPETAFRTIETVIGEMTEPVYTAPTEAAPEG
jgi:hypothetical protein